MNIRSTSSLASGFSGVAPLRRRAGLAITGGVLTAMLAIESASAAVATPEQNMARITAFAGVLFLIVAATRTVTAIQIHKPGEAIRGSVLTLMALPFAFAPAMVQQFGYSVTQTLFGG